MREHCHRALAIAAMLDDMGAAVTYPGLPYHPQHELLKSIRNPDYGFGGILAVDCQTREKADTLMEILQNQEKFGLIAVSLGYFDTLMSCPGSSTSSEIPEAEQRKMGLSPGLMRLSVGYTGSLEKRLHQIKRAVEQIGLV